MITFDAVTRNGNDGTNTTTWSHTCTGSNGCLLVICDVGNSSTPPI